MSVDALLDEGLQPAVLTIEALVEPWCLVVICQRWGGYQSRGEVGTQIGN